MENATETREVSVKELTQAFEGKYVHVSFGDCCGIGIEIPRGTVEYKDGLKPKLLLASRDGDNNITGSVSVDEYAITSIKEHKNNNGIYAVTFLINVAGIDISEYKPLE